MCRAAKRLILLQDKLAFVGKRGQQSSTGKPENIVSTAYVFISKSRCNDGNYKNVVNAY